MFNLYIKFILTEQPMSREFQIFPVEHMEPRFEPYIIELRLLECCWHPDPYLEFQPLQAHSNIEGIKRLPPEQDECNVFPGQTDYEVLLLLYYFLDPDTLFYVSTQFRSRWKAMVSSIRRRVQLGDTSAYSILVSS
jgi:hypothetical protein